MSALDYDLTTLDRREFSYGRQLAELEAEGWELDPTSSTTSTSYLRRHRRIAEIDLLIRQQQGKKIRFSHDEDGLWTATLSPPPRSSEPEPKPQGTTALEAAEAAWKQYESAI